MTDDYEMNKLICLYYIDGQVMPKSSGCTLIQGNYHELCESAIN
jgi:hypothetical protein